MPTRSFLRTFSLSIFLLPLAAGAAPVRVTRTSAPPTRVQKARSSTPGRTIANGSYRPTTKVGRLVAAFRAKPRASVVTPRPGTSEGTYADVANEKMFIDGVSVGDVDQGHLGDCYFVAALASVAYAQPKLLENAITERPDGSLSVRLYHRASDGHYETDDVTVDKLVPVSGTGRPSFAHGQVAGQMWPAWIQKAYAAHSSLENGKGTYDQIGKGGFPSSAFEALTGKPARDLYVDPSLSSNLYAPIEQALLGQHPVVAFTPQKLPEGAPVHESHTYSILGIRTVEGKQMIKVRNPWGYSEPGDPNGGDGIFELELAEFAKNFTTVTIGG